jgi:hypothetical protein
MNIEDLKENLAETLDNIDLSQSNAETIKEEAKEVISYCDYAKDQIEDVISSLDDLEMPTITEAEIKTVVVASLKDLLPDNFLIVTNDNAYPYPDISTFGSLSRDKLINDITNGIAELTK